MTDPSESKPTTRARLPSEEIVAHAIVTVIQSSGRSVSPEDVARSVAKGPEWQSVLPVVRRVAQRMARQGDLIIYRKGKPVDPEDFRGVYRLGLPTPSGDT